MTDKTGSPLLTLLSKLVDGSVGGIDDSYLDNLLTVITADISSQKQSPLQLCSWLCTVVPRWTEVLQDASLACFTMQLCALLAKDEKIFKRLAEASCIDAILSASLATHPNFSIRCSYLKAVSQLGCHEAGVAMLREKKIWIVAIGLFLNDSSLVRLEALAFLRLQFTAEKDNPSASKEILQEILKVLLQHPEAPTGNAAEAAAEKSLTPCLKLIDGLLDDLIADRKANSVGDLLINEFKLDAVLNRWLEVASKDSWLGTLVKTYSTLILATLPDDGPGEVPGILALYHSLLNSNRICAFLILSRNCLNLWVRLRARRRQADDQIEMHFFIMQLMPLMVSFRKKVRLLMHQYLDQRVNEVTDRMSVETFRMCYTARDAFQLETAQFIMREATLALHGLMDIRKMLARDKLLIAFQTYAWLLKNFVPTTCEIEDEPDENEVRDAGDLCESAGALLHAILQALAQLIEENHFVWREAFEGLCLLKLCYWLLRTPLSVKGTVLTLRLTKLCIQECMPPSLVLLMDCIEGTALEYVGPLLIRKLNDLHWEVRDSALEVIAVIADLAKDKYPVFQELLLDLRCCPLGVSMMTDDAESYVRASAVQAVSAMISADKLWNDSLVNLDVSRLVQKTIKEDSEGIVRREAALLLANLLRCGRIHPPEMEQLYETMLWVVINDLDGETRINALQFWDEVIEMELQNEAMVDGVFPPVTFSRVSKKIVTLTPAEIKTRLLRVMDRLSAIGCLNALLTALLEDCDDEVVVAASKVVKKLVDLLNLYHVVDSPAVRGKRKHSPDRRTCRPSSVSSQNSQKPTTSTSEEVIDGIVNSSDLKLLANVVHLEGDQPMASAEGEQQQITAASPGKQPITLATVDVFLARVQEVDLSAEPAADDTADLATLLADVLSLDKGEERVPDCY